jgi:2-C-methyl-D-erythritol 2,4-cyclodiphosphate synthase
MRVGIGYDVHAFTPGDQVTLGGVRIEHTRSLSGHSDADVLVHAIMDALFGAAGLPDIGVHFPDSDPAYSGISSLRLLELTVSILKEKGYQVVNIDSTLIAEEPKVAVHRAQMAFNIAGLLGVSPGDVGVKATTNERMGFIGRGEGIAAMAVALIERS